MRKINKKRVIITCVCTAAVAALFQTCYVLSPKNFERKLKKAGLEVSDDAVYGGFNSEGFEQSFSLVNCGNYNSRIYEDEIKLLEDTSKPTGIIIETNPRNYSDIYKDFDYTKELVDEYFVEYPICLKINSLYYANSIDKEEIYNYVKVYLEKAKAYGLTVYVIGDKYCMCSIENDFNREHYKFNKGLIVDNDINYSVDGYDIIIGEKYIYCSKDFRSNKLLNSSKTFIEDFEYTVKDNDTKDSIGKQFDMTGDDILKYNNLTAEPIENKKIIIPSRYHDTYVLGIDISSYQYDIDFEALKSAGVEFVLQRVGYTTQSKIDSPYIVDINFNHNSNGLSKVGIKQGVYYYTRANTTDEIDKEVDLLLKQLEGHDITLPVYIDLEGESLDKLKDDSTRANELVLINRFCNLVEQAGYTAGIYINYEYIKYLEEIKDKYTIWAAGGYYYNIEQSLNDMYVTTYLDDGIQVFQNTKKGNTEKLGIESEYVCLDYATSDYIKTKKMN